MLLDFRAAALLFPRRHLPSLPCLILFGRLRVRVYVLVLEAGRIRLVYVLCCQEVAYLLISCGGGRQGVKVQVLVVLEGSATLSCVVRDTGSLMAFVIYSEVGCGAKGGWMCRRRIG